MKTFFIFILKTLILLLNTILLLVFVLPPLVEQPANLFWTNPLTWIQIILFLTVTAAGMIKISRMKKEKIRYRYIFYQNLIVIYIKTALTVIWIIWYTTGTKPRFNEMYPVILGFSIFALVYAYFVYLVRAKKLRNSALTDMIAAVKNIKGSTAAPENSSLYRFIESENRKIKGGKIKFCSISENSRQAIALQSKSSTHITSTDLDAVKTPLNSFQQERTDWYYCFAGESSHKAAADKKSVKTIRKMDKQEWNEEQRKGWSSLLNNEKIVSLQMGRGFYMVRWQNKISLRSMGYEAPQTEKLEELTEKFKVILG